MRLEDHAKGATMTDASRADTTPSRRHSPIRRDSPIAPSSTLFPAAALPLVIIALGGCAVSTPMIGSQVSGTADHSTMVTVQDTEAEDAPDPETTTLEQADGQAKSELDAAVAAVEEAGADISYIVLNLENGQTIEHNADRAYYSASTIKAPFCISLVRAQGDAARTNYGGLITSTIVNSDNEAYRTLRERLYGQSFFGELSAQAGAPCDLTHWYCDYSVRDLANIWRVCADWLATDDPCAQWLRDMLGDTLNSRVDDIAGIDQASTWSKAGWFSGEARYNVTFDGGVVNTPQGSYAIAVATNRGSDFKSIESVMRPLVSLANARLSEA